MAIDHSLNAAVWRATRRVISSSDGDSDIDKEVWVTRDCNGRYSAFNSALAKAMIAKHDATLIVKVSK